MTRHSTLTNSDDLHYAKVRTFSGDPNLVTPDFIDQIIASSDLNKVYRAFGLNQGEIVELLSPANSNLVEVGNEYPISPPLTAGLIFSAVWASQLYVSVENSFGLVYWKPFQWNNNFFTLECLVNYEDLPHSDQAVFSLLYSPMSTDAIESASFEFTEVVHIVGQATAPIDLSYVMRGIGRGAYAVGFTVENPNNFILYANLYDAASNLPSAFSFRNSPNNISAFGNSLNSKYLFYTGDIVTETLSLGAAIHKLDIGA